MIPRLERILVIGAGAVGGYVGGHLAQAGREVTLMARGAHLEALQKEGLLLVEPEGSLRIRTRAVECPSPLEVFDLIIYCVKAYDLERALDQTRAHLSPTGTVISLLNGVEAPDVLARVFGAHRVVAGIAFIGAFIERPGVVRRTARAFLTLGEMDGSLTPRLEALKSLLEGAGIPVRLTQHIRREQWRKLVWNAGFNPLSALTGFSAQDVLKHPPLRETLILVMEEVVAVAARLGFDLGADTVQKQIRATEEVSEIIPSMLQDRRRGKPLESEALNGVVVRKGREVGVPTPVNLTLYALTRALHPGS